MLELAFSVVKLRGWKGTPFLNLSFYSHVKYTRQGGRRTVWGRKEEDSRHQVPEEKSGFLTTPNTRKVFICPCCTMTCRSEIALHTQSVVLSENHHHLSLAYPDFSDVLDCKIFTYLRATSCSVFTVLCYPH